MKIQTQSIGNHLGFGNNEILKDGWVNMSRFSNNSNYGALATSFTLVAVGSSGLLAGSILYDQSSIEFTNDELTHIVHAYNRYENWYALKDSYFDLIDNSIDRLERIAVVVEDLCQQDLAKFAKECYTVCKYNQQHLNELSLQIPKDFPGQFQNYINERFRF